VRLFDAKRRRCSGWTEHQTHFDAYKKAFAIRCELRFHTLDRITGFVYICVGGPPIYVLPHASANLTGTGLNADHDPNAVSKYKNWPNRATAGTHPTSSDVELVKSHTVTHWGQCTILRLQPADYRLDLLEHCICYVCQTVVIYKRVDDW
jgi:hypothetical protein